APGSLLQVESERIPAGARDVVLRLPADAVHGHVRGRVVADDGTGFAGVTVKALRMTVTYEFPTGGTRDECAEGTQTVTDADGRSARANVAREGVELFASGDAMLFASVQLGPHTDPDAVEIHAERRVHLQVELDAPIDRADRLRVLDADGKGLVLRI